METLAGQVVAVDVDAAATLGAMREGIARQTGILVKQQRLIVLGDPAPLYPRQRRPPCSSLALACMARQCSALQSVCLQLLCGAEQGGWVSRRGE